MKRIVASTVTEAIAESMDIADSIEHIIILYQHKTGHSQIAGQITNDDCKIETANWLVDCYKAWLIKCILP